MNKPKWKCDKCFESINSPEEGYVEWYRHTESDKMYNFHVVHHTKECKYDEKRIFREEKSSTPGNHLKYFLGLDGLIRLLRLLGDDKLLNRQELIELVQRIQVPGYDTALNRFDEAYAEGYIDGPRDGVYYPSLSNIENINRRIDSNHN